ncbi:MAG TPA: cysteine synthase A, partial [Lachnospiraceae bacterium]|nr:cysteine synthase A [Lachnospiraceae bacterium]
DRVARKMIEEAMKNGEINQETTIVEPTSGNTGIGLASVCASYGLKLIITMPETMSIERRNLMKAYGAELVLTDGAKGMKGAIEKAEQITKET